MWPAHIVPVRRQMRGLTRQSEYRAYRGYARRQQAENRNGACQPFRSMSDLIAGYLLASRIAIPARSRTTPTAAASRKRLVTVSMSMSIPRGPHGWLAAGSAPSIFGVDLPDDRFLPGPQAPSH